MRKITIAAAVLLGLGLHFTPARAGDAEQDATRRWLDGLKLQTGHIELPQASASLELKPGYGFLPAQDAQRVLHDLWGNPPAPDVLGLLLPSTDKDALLDADSWAVVITYANEGYVSDADAATTDYGAMLKDLQQSARDSNAERDRQGYPAVDLVGWAEPPHYDAASHKLYWARDLKFSKNGQSEGHSLNYDIRVLGRDGYLSLNAVAPIGQLAKVSHDMPQVLAMTEFDAGKRYQDYDSKTDKLAAYGIGALVAGGIAAKAGLFAKLGLLLLGLKKFLIIGVLAIGALLKKLFTRRSS